MTGEAPEGAPPGLETTEAGVHAPFFAGVTLAGFAVLIPISLARGGSGGANLATAIIGGLFVLYFALRWDPLLARLAVFSLTVGLFEAVFADPFYVTSGALRYAAGSARLLSSPLYMPIAWAGVVAQLAFLGALLGPRLGLPGASAAVAALGGLELFGFEALACGAGFWSYRGHDAAPGVPAAVVAAEVVISLGLPPAFTWGRRGPLSRSALAGLGVGLWMGLASRVTHAIWGGAQ